MVLNYDQKLAKHQASQKRNIENAIARKKHKLEATLYAAISKVKEQARQDTWCTPHDNCFHFTIGKGESEAHIMAKFKRFIELRRMGYTVFSELRWKGKDGRSDLVVCGNNGDVWIEEILCSETEEKLLAKTDKYPFPIKKFYAKEIL